MFRIKKSVRIVKIKDCTLFMYIFKGTDNVGTYAFLNEVVSIADLVAYRNFLIINLVSSCVLREQTVYLCLKSTHFICVAPRHMCPVPAIEAYRECCHCSTHSSPLFHFKDGRTLTSKSFRSTFLPLVWWSYVATIQPNITPTLVQPCTAAARTPFGTSEEVKQSIPDIRIGAATVHVNSNC